MDPHALALPSLCPSQACPVINFILLVLLLANTLSFIVRFSATLLTPSRRLGRGAFASVRRAIGIHDGRSYAVKIIQQAKWGPTHAKMFEREIHIIRGLRHPNIVACCDVFLDPSTICASCLLSFLR